MSGRKHYTLSDIGNARRFADENPDLGYLYDSPKSWVLLIDPAGWCVLPDKDGETLRRAKAMVERMAAEAVEHMDKDLARWAHKSSSLARLRAILVLARDEMAVRAINGRFERAPKHESA